MSPPESPPNDIQYSFLLQNGIPAIWNNAVGPLALICNFSFFAHAGGTNYMATWSIVQSTIGFCQGICNFLLYVPMAQMAQIVGRKNINLEQVKWSILWTIGISICVGLICVFGLWAGFYSGSLYQLMKVLTELQPLVWSYFQGRIVSILCAFLAKVGTGILVGKQHVQLVTVLNTIMNVLDVGLNYGVLFVWKKGLFEAGLATSIANLVGVFILVPTAYWIKPNTNIVQNLKIPENKEMDVEDVPPEGSFDDESDSFDIFEFLQSSSNMMIRSICLQSAMYSLTVMASRLGPNTLSAHQIILQLWSLVSYTCDGFADVGTMVGGRLLGGKQNETMKILTLRLFWLGFLLGVLCLVVLMIWKENIISLFIHPDTDEEIYSLLENIWTFIACMQPINAMVYISDGLLFAHQAFGFVRNLMVIGVCLIFGPVLIMGYSLHHSLLWIWIAKSCLSVWRCIAAFWFCVKYFQSVSKKSQTDLGISKGVLTENSPLLRK